MIRTNQSMPKQLTSLVVDGYDAIIFVEKGQLRIKDGFATDGGLRDIRFPRGRCAIDRIVVRAPGGSMSIAALDWCHRMGITLAVVGSDSHIMNCLIPDQPHDGPVKRAQAISAVTHDAVAICHWLLKRKFASQIAAIEIEMRKIPGIQFQEGNRNKAIAEIRKLAAEVPQCDRQDALLAIEGRAAQSYWSVLAGTALPWPDWALRRIPDHWARISARDSGGRSRVRDARDPFNATLNYAYTLLEVEGRVACAAHGLDPDLGLLHVDDRLRESFIYDLIEPVRSTVDVLVLEFIASKGIRPFMFHELRDGVVRLDPDFARPLAQWLMPRLRKPLDEVAAGYVMQLRRVHVPYRLARLEHPSTLRYRTGSGRTPPTNLGLCEYCRERVPKKGLKFCGRHCYLRHSVEVRQPIKLAQQRLAEMRAQGLDPGHGGEAAKKRGQAMARTNSQNALNLTKDQWRARRALQQRQRRQREPEPHS